MPLPVTNTEYHVNTFLDMQKDLSNYLNEAHDIDGEWTIDEKKRMINQGCIAVAAKIMRPKKIIEETIVGTADDEINEIVLPSAILKPLRLFIDSLEYSELDLDQFVQRFTDISSIPTISNIPSQRVFWLDEARNILNIRPKISSQLNMLFYVILMPKLLINDNDISDMNPVFSYVPPLWAAWKMLYRDEEHRDRGTVALRDFNIGIDEYIEFRNKSVGNKVEKMKLDPKEFTRNFDPEAIVDFGDTFDRLP